MLTFTSPLPPLIAIFTALVVHEFLGLPLVIAQATFAIVLGVALVVWCTGMSRLQPEH